jgi:transposase
MGEYIGLDVSLKETALSVRRDGQRIWRGKCPSDPALIAEVVRKRAPAAERVVFETGPLSVWFYHALQAEGLPAICIDARHAKAALDMAPNKTDANDADGLAQRAQPGCRPGATASRQRPAECGLSAADVTSRGRRDYRCLVHGRYRGSCQLQQVALSRRLAGPDDPPLSVRRG